MLKIRLYDFCLYSSCFIDLYFFCFVFVDNNSSKKYLHFLKFSPKIRMGQIHNQCKFQKISTDLEVIQRTFKFNIKHQTTYFKSVTYSLLFEYYYLFIRCFQYESHLIWLYIIIHITYIFMSCYHVFMFVAEDINIKYICINLLSKQVSNHTFKDYKQITIIPFIELIFLQHTFAHRFWLV